MKRLFTFLATGMASLALLGALLFSAANVTPASAATISASGNCSSARVTISATNASLVVYAYVFRADNSFEYLANTYTSTSSTSLTYSLSWLPQPESSFIGFGVYDYNTGYYSNTGYNCHNAVANVPGPGIPPNSVMAYFPAQTTLYSSASTTSPISGAVILAGQSWFVYEYSADKQFLHVYIANGQVAWVPAGSARLQGSLAGSSTCAPENNDSCTSSAAPTTVPYTVAVVSVAANHIPPPNVAGATVLAPTKIPTPVTPQPAGG